MDGYAVRAADTPGALPVVGHSAAGRPARARLGAGEAIEISTGAVVPDGADAVIPVERVVVRPRGSRSLQRSLAGDNIRRRGGDVRAGDEVLAAGHVLTAARIGAIAACGIDDRRRAPRSSRHDPRHRFRAAPAGGAARAGPDLRVERDHARGRARGGRRGRRATRAGRGHGSGLEGARRGLSKRMSSSPPAASRSGRTTSSAGSRRGSASRRSSGAWRCGPASRSRSVFVARRSSSGCRATRSRRSWERCSSLRPRCAPSRATRSGAAVPAGRRSPGVAARPERDDFARARISWSETGPSSTRSPGRSRT